MKLLRECTEEEKSKVWVQWFYARRLALSKGKPEPEQPRFYSVPEKILQEYEAFPNTFSWRKENGCDPHGNPMPDKITSSGNLSANNRALEKSWGEYFQKLRPAERIMCIEDEVRGLAWSLTQRGLFIGMEKSNYSKGLKKAQKKFGPSPG